LQKLFTNIRSIRKITQPCYKRNAKCLPPWGNTITARPENSYKNNDKFSTFNKCNKSSTISSRNHQEAEETINITGIKKAVVHGKYKENMEKIK
jgi:hypothetical protein